MNSTKKNSKKMIYTEELRKMQTAEEKEYKFASASQLQSFTSVIAYTNRLYMKPEGKILRYSRNFDLLYCRVRCVGHELPYKEEEVYP